MHPASAAALDSESFFCSRSLRMATENGTGSVFMTGTVADYKSARNRKMGVDTPQVDVLVSGQQMEEDR